MNLYNYLVCLETILRARDDWIVRDLEVYANPAGVKFSAEVEFPNGSVLYVTEEWIMEPNTVQCVHYIYHYQDRKGNLIFRYDNAPHHPEVETHPEHKHVGTRVVAARRPDLADVLREIDDIIYKE